MHTEEIKIHKGEWLTNALERQGYKNIPSNVILDKTLTGLGATYTEIHSDRNSIILEPNVPVIIEKTEDVFDITVPEFHNFAIDCGIFVHNCNGTKDIADAVCGALWNCKRSKNIINIAKLSSVILNPNENAAYSKLSEEEKQALEFAEFERARTQMSNTILRKL